MLLGLLALLGLSGHSRAGGLLWAFEQSVDGLRLGSLHAIERAPPARASGPHDWRLVILDADGVELESRAVPVPQAFHAGSDATPYVVGSRHWPPGSRLALHDGAGVRRIEVVLDEALLGRAVAASKARLAPMAALPPPAADSALGRQLVVDAAPQPAALAPSAPEPLTSDAKAVAGADHQVQLRLLDAAGAPLSVLASGFLSGYDPVLGSRQITGSATPGRLRFAVPTGFSGAFLAQLYFPADYASLLFRVGVVDGDRDLPLALQPASAVVAELRASDGSAIPGGSTVSCSSVERDGLRYFDGGTVDAAGRRAMRLPLAEPYQCTASVAPPLMSRSFAGLRFAAGEPLLLSLPRGNRVQFRLQLGDGSAYDGSGEAFWNDPALGLSGQCSPLPCALTLPAATPITVGIRFPAGDAFEVERAAQAYDDGSEHVLVIRRRHLVSGTVREGSGAGYSVRVRAFDAEGGFVLSTLTSGGGQYELPLAEGRYRLEFDGNRENASLLVSPFYSTPVTRDVDVAGAVLLADVALDLTAGTLRLPLTLPCDAGVEAIVGVTTSAGRRIERALPFDDYALLPTATPGTCTAQLRVRLAPGTFLVSLQLPGWPLRTLGEVLIDGAADVVLPQTFSTAERSERWTLRVLDPDGQPLAQARVQVYDDRQHPRFAATSDSDGWASVPVAAGWIAELTPPPSFALGERVRTLLHIGEEPLPLTVGFDALPLIDVEQAGLRRLLGNGDLARRYNIVFVAEGYVEQPESYVDANGNGVWDGVIWRDGDADGVFDYGEAYWRYGTAPTPQPGQSPIAGNEAFDDLNADGAPSIDDRALFAHHARAFLRSLFGADFWREQGRAFNAFALFTPSAEAGYDIREFNGSLSLQRNTRYGALLNRGNGVLQVNVSTAIAEVMAVLPETDLVVVLANQPIPAGRASAFRGAPSGLVMPATTLSGIGTDVTPSHEMGHALAALCDEYTEYVAVSPQAGRDPAPCANMSHRHEADRVPWSAALLAAGVTTAPSFDLRGGLGVFEGGFFAGGSYRPSLNSTMRHSSPAFNLPSRLALQQALEARVDLDYVFATGFEAPAAAGGPPSVER